jgi:hypothetical protein
VASPAPVQAQRVRFAERHSKEPLYRGPIRFARASAYIPAMDDLAYWTKKLQAAEQELDAATTRTAINGAAKRVLLAKSPGHKCSLDAAREMPATLQSVNLCTILRRSQARRTSCTSSDREGSISRTIAQTAS